MWLVLSWLCRCISTPGSAGFPYKLQISRHMWGVCFVLFIYFNGSHLHECVLLG